MLAIAGTACSRDTPAWGSERAKAEVANYLYSDSLDGWELTRSGRVGRSRPKKLMTGDWVAEYQRKGEWKVEGAALGVWFAFEDGSLPVQRVKPVPTLVPTPTVVPLLNLGLASLVEGGDLMVYLLLEDCGLRDVPGNSFTIRDPLGTSVEIVEVASECSPPRVRIKLGTAGVFYWVRRMDVVQ